MSELNALIEQMVSDISDQSLRLDDPRFRLSLNWLIAHSCEVKAAIQVDVAGPQRSGMEERFRLALEPWLESLPVQGMLWEYHLILDEVAWWRDLDPHRLKMILKSGAGK